MAVIVANIYQQAAMCTTEKHRAPSWLAKLALIHLPPLLRMEEKVKAVLNQRVSMISIYQIKDENKLNN